MKEVEYRVRPVARYVVTRWHKEVHEDNTCSGGVETLGEFANEDAAKRVMLGMSILEGEDRSLVIEGTGDTIGWTMKKRKAVAPSG